MTKSTNSETMVKIPAAIASLPLAINEKIVLAIIDENPGSRNADLAKAIGMTERGMKKLVLRLKSAGHLEQLRRGRARRLFLTFHVEQGTAFPESEIPMKPSNWELCSDVQHAATTVTTTARPAHVSSLEQAFEDTLRTIDDITRQRDFFPETVVRLLQPLIARVKAEMDDSPKKARILSELMTRLGAFAAVALAAGLPKEAQRRLDDQISQATAEQLRAFGQRALAENSMARSTSLLAALCSDEAKHE